MDNTIHRLMIDPPFRPFGREDAQVLALARWFKTSYMTWIDPIKCPTCGGSTKSMGLVTPNEAEFKKGAGRVELHVCTEDEGKGCGGQRRFQRYNDFNVLLQTREGRCGK